ncbi:hypothetical protein BHM03_00040194 [Ensete ventricosum]|nr:hypothetical protein BHM03_00040194 [Ensete ventricosum]
MARWGAGHKLPQFQVKDQIGSFFCFPSVDFGGYGGFIINNRDVIAVPFDKPHGDITLFIGDWYNKDYKARRLKPSRRLHQKQRVPDEAIPPCVGSQKGPRQREGSPDARRRPDERKAITSLTVLELWSRQNVGISTGLNFRIQNHNMLLVETQGSYTVQQNYTNLDIHVGQSYSFLVTMDQNPSSDYYTVASARFVNESRWSRDTGVAVLHCSNSKGKASGPLPDPPNDFYDKTFSMNQARSIRFVCGGKNHKEQLDTDISRLCGCVCYQVESERWRGAAESSGIVQIRNDQCVSGVRPEEQATGGDQRKTTMDYGEWTEESRGTYNKGDGVARCSTQVFPGAWTAILVSLDNVGIWNVRAQNLDSWYLGQEVYVRVVNPENTNKTELPIPDNALYCGRLQKYQTKSTPFLLQIFQNDAADSSPQDSFICFGDTSNLRVTGADASPAWNCLMQTLLWHYPTCFKTGVLPKNLYYKQRTNLLHHYAGSTLENMKGYLGSNDG